MYFHFFIGIFHELGSLNECRATLWKRYQLTVIIIIIINIILLLLLVK